MSKSKWIARAKMLSELAESFRATSREGGYKKLFFKTEDELKKEYKYDFLVSEIDRMRKMRGGN